MRLADLDKIIKELIPQKAAQSWDNVGLQVGNRSTDITGITLAVDISRQTINETLKCGANVVLSHHPLIFKPLTRVISDDTIGGLIELLIKNNVAAYCCHTNLDSVSWGVSDALARAIGLDASEYLSYVEGEKTYKLVTFVPFDHLQDVRNAVCEAGAGQIGDYSFCTFSAKGFGTFLGGDSTKPAIGEAGKLETAEEERFEVIVDQKNVVKVIEEMKKAHPYEEVAYDLIPLANPSNYGLGKIGSLKEAASIKKIVDILKEKLRTDGIRYTGQPEKMVKKIAVCGGSGSSLIESAIERDAELFIAGEFGYHHALEAKERGLPIIELGHGLSETLVLDVLKSKLSKKFKQNGIEEISISIAKESDVWTYV